VFAAPAYLARAGVPSHPRELEGTHHRVVGYRGARAGRPLMYAMTRGDETVEVAGRATLTVDDGNAYLAAGLAGIGLLWLPRYMADAHVAAGDLRPVFEDWRLAPMPLYLAYRPNPHVSARLRVFIDWVVALLARQLPR
jgi:DNA-binding transcriptional LysR family regulator